MKNLFLIIDLIFIFLLKVYPFRIGRQKSYYLSGKDFKSYDSNKDLSLRSKKLVVWDCDGVLVDSEALLKQGEVEALAAAGFNLTIDDCVRLFSGVSPDKATENFYKEIGKPLPEGFFKKQIEGSMDLFRKRLKPLMKNTVNKLFDSGVTMCVASGSPRNRVELCLDVGGMGHCFSPDKIFTRELVQRGKPAPDLFLYSAEKLGFKPNECIVIEDATSGIEAAQAAQMKVLGFLGAGHVKSEWYQKAVRKYDIPIYETENEIYEAILEFLNS